MRSLAADVRRARQAAENGEADVVARRCRAALETFDATPIEAVTQSTVDALDEFIDLCSAIGRYDLALEVCKRLICLDPDNEELELDLAICHFELAQFEEAEDRLKVLEAECDPHPEIEWYLGALAERSGDFERADQRFLRAHRLARQDFPPPLKVDAKHIDRLLDETIDGIPHDTYEVIRDVPIILDPIPATEILHLAKPPFSPLILGLHHGMDLRHGSVFHTVPTIDGIRVFHRNVAKYAWDLPQFDREFTTTLLHEIGHRLGLDEEDLWERGL